MTYGIIGISLLEGKKSKVDVLSWDLVKPLETFHSLINSDIKAKDHFRPLIVHCSDLKKHCSLLYVLDFFRLSHCLTVKYLICCAQHVL